MDCIFSQTIRQISAPTSPFSEPFMPDLEASSFICGRTTLAHHQMQLKLFERGSEMLSIQKVLCLALLVQRAGCGRNHHCSLTSLWSLVLCNKRMLSTKNMMRKAVGICNHLETFCGCQWGALRDGGSKHLQPSEVQQNHECLRFGVCTQR